MNFGEISKNFLERQRKTLREASFANMRYSLESYVLPVFGEFSVKEISEEKIRKGIEKIAAENPKLGAGTLSKILALVKQVAKFGIKSDEIPPFLLDFKVDFDDFSGKNSKKIQENEKKPGLSDEDAQKITAKILENPTSESLGFLISLRFGLKVGEICALRWSDFDIGGRNLSVKRTIQRVADGNGSSRITEVALGHESSVRTLHFSERTAAFLKENFGEMLEKDSLSRSFFVTTNWENPHEPRTYRRIFSRFLSRIGLPPLKFSALEKFFKSERDKRLSAAKNGEMPAQ